MSYLPGDELVLELTQKGQDSHQAVGYLHDGTMVVVEQAKKFLGQKKRIEIIRSLQTDAGKMMFAKVCAEPKEAKEAVQHSPTQAAPKQSKQRSTGRRPQTSKAAKPDASRVAAQSHRSARPKTQSQREADLIRMVNEQ